MLVGFATDAPGYAYYSTDFGSTWILTEGPLRRWNALASSGDGLAVAALDTYSRLVLTSTNGGRNWRTNSPPISDVWSSIASSADGNRLIVAAGASQYTGTLFTSTNAGVSWISNNLPKQYWGGVASSADGKTLVAMVVQGYLGPIYISTNAGFSWSLTSAPTTNWGAITISADGTKIAACTDRNYDGALFTSTNRGLTWQSQVVLLDTPRKLASSADGATLFLSSGRDIAMLQTMPTPVIEATISNQQLALSWIVPSAPFVLQQTSDLRTPQWTDVPIPPVLIFTNLHFQVTVPASNPAAYYRLSSP